MPPLITLCSVSWIDQKGLPTVGFSTALSAAMPKKYSWPHRVIIGLVGTSNPEPPPLLKNMGGFRSRQQYRAMLALSLNNQSPLRTSGIVIDPGYTPPINKSKIDFVLRDLMPFPDDQTFHPGEKSALSGVEIGRLHQNSALNVPQDHKVLVSAIIKFRAGSATDKVGVDEAGSPVHVPWVWCEYALLSSSKGYRLLAQGSRFPSHSWYVNGKQVKKVYQTPIKATENEPAIATGRPAKLARADPKIDKSTGPIFKNEFTIAKGEAFDIDVTRYVV